MAHNKDRIFAGHIPVVHRGYLDLLQLHRGADIRVFDETITSQFDYLRKDIRMLETDEVIHALTGLGQFATAIGLRELQTGLQHNTNSFVLIDDDLSHHVVSETEAVTAEITFASPFLRWDRNNTNAAQSVTPDRYVTLDDEKLAALYGAAERSSDWWRHVGAAIIDEDGTVISHYNHGVPHEHINSLEGDPRITANRGSAIENSLFIHAEADLIAAMAKEGVSSKDKDIYVTTFPCPNCAKLIAASGMRACYFVEGYAMLDGERTLRDAGVEIIQIATDAPKASSERLRPYPEKN